MRSQKRIWSIKYQGLVLVGVEVSNHELLPLSTLPLFLPPSASTQQVPIMLVSALFSALVMVNEYTLFTLIHILA